MLQESRKDHHVSGHFPYLVSGFSFLTNDPADRQPEHKINTCSNSQAPGAIPVNTKQNIGKKGNGVNRQKQKEKSSEHTYRVSSLDRVS